MREKGAACSEAAERVYFELLKVKKGEVITYADLARAAGIPGAQRAVGTMMAANPWPGIVPCHRVVRADGSVGRYAYGHGIKEKMLESEGVAIRGGKIVGFEKIRRRGRGARTRTRTRPRR